MASGQYFRFPDSISAIPDSKSIFLENSRSASGKEMHLDDNLINLSTRYQSNSGCFSQREKLQGYKEALAAAKAFSYCGFGFDP